MNKILFIVFFVNPIYLISQNIFDLGIELQVYPTGIIPGVHFETQVGELSTLSARLGLNLFDHRDLGVHDDETGNGYGFTLGFHRYFKEGYQGWKLGVKVDYWNNNVDWYDDDAGGRIEGMSEITVLQPTIEAGYSIVKNSIFITPSLAFGMEWNVKTQGEPTGEGPILLLGISVGKRF